MMLPKLQQWLDRDFFPQRVLLSGEKNGFETVVKVAAKLQDEKESTILSEICPDTLILRNEGTFKIGDKEKPEKKTVRGMINWVMQTPVKNHRIVILEDFERTGRDANHALLKVLEEPPPRAIFLFTTRNHHQILETIISRMTVVRVPHDFEDFEINEDVKNFFQSSNLIWKFRKIDNLDKAVKKQKDKKIIFNFIDDLIIHARFFEQYHQYLDQLFEIQKAIMANQNTKLVLERFVLQITPQ